MDPLSRLHLMALQWGGRLEKVSDDLFRELVRAGITDEAPFSSDVGLIYLQGVVSYTADAKIGEIIHEMGHVFASKVAPADSKEWDFFGWEYALARYARCEVDWVLGASDYGLGKDWECNDFGQVTEEIRAQVLTERVAYGKSIKIITPTGRPRSVRRDLRIK